MQIDKNASILLYKRTIILCAVFFILEEIEKNDL